MQITFTLVPIWPFGAGLVGNDFIRDTHIDFNANTIDLGDAPLEPHYFWASLPPLFPPFLLHLNMRAVCCFTQASRLSLARRSSIRQQGFASTTTRAMKATWEGATLAQSDDTVVVEGNQ